MIKFLRNIIIALTLVLWNIELIAQQKDNSQEEGIKLTEQQEAVVLSYADSLFNLLKQNNFSFIKLDTVLMPNEAKEDWLNKVNEHADFNPKISPYISLKEVRYTKNDYVFSLNCAFAKRQKKSESFGSGKYLFAKYYFVFSGLLKYDIEDDSVSLINSVLITWPNRLRQWFYHMMSIIKFSELLEDLEAPPAPPFLIPDFMEDEVPSKNKR